MSLPTGWRAAAGHQAADTSGAIIKLLEFFLRVIPSVLPTLFSSIFLFLFFVFFFKKKTPKHVPSECKLPRELIPEDYIIPLVWHKGAQKINYSCVNSVTTAAAVSLENPLCVCLCARGLERGHFLYI